MSLLVPPDLEARVTALANSTRSDPQSLLAKLLREALERDEVDASINAGWSAAQAGDVKPAEEVAKRLRAR